MAAIYKALPLEEDILNFILHVIKLRKQGVPRNAMQSVSVCAGSSICTCILNTKKNTKFPLEVLAKAAQMKKLSNDPVQALCQTNDK